MFRRMLLALALLAPFSARAAPADIALTFDDLPALTVLNSQAYVDYANVMIIRGLKHHHFPAIGFVNEGKFNELERDRQIANVRRWRDGGFDLGNHTFSHESPNDRTAAAYIADIERGEPVTRELLAQKGRKMHWFRHPYLETGFPAAEKAKINAWLAEHGYKIAPVTMENSDWLFAEPYDDAIARHDAARIARIKAAYLEYTERMIVWYQEASQALEGRQIAFVMLLHVTRLNADAFEDLAALLKKHQLHPVTLEKAMADPAYETHDPYVGKDGVEWLERWSLEKHRDLPWDKFTEPPNWVEAEYRKVDNDH
jgi:peptidoglycan/xylan/chitin deacetylase (PgdA/CDA1 family)